MPGETSTGSFSRSVLEYGAVACVLLLAFFWYTYPLLWHLDTRIPGAGDVGVFYWNIFHFKEALARGQWFTFTDWQEYPFGVDLTFHANTPLLGLFSLMFENHALAFNLFILIHVLLAGLGAYALVKHFTGSFYPSIFGAILFSISNYMMLRILGGHTNLISIGFVPFFFLGFFKAFAFRENLVWPELKSAKALGISALFLVLIFLSDFVVTFGVLFTAGFFFMGHWLVFWLRKYAWWKIALGLILFFSFCHQMVHWCRYYWHFNDGAGFYFGADLLWYLIPNQNRIYNSDLVNWAVSKYMPHGYVEGSTFLGFVTVLLFFTVLWIKKRYQWHFDHRQRILSVVLVLLVLVSLPSFSIAQHRIIYSPTSFLHFIPVLNNYRCPARISIFLALFLPVWMAYVLPPSGHSWSKKLWLLGSCLLLLEFWPKPIPLQTISPPPQEYTLLSQQKGIGGLFIPFGILDGQNGFGVYDDLDHLMYTEVHQKKIIGGYASRIPAETMAKFTGSKVLQDIVALQKGAPAQTSPQEIDQFIAAFQPDFIFIREPYLTPEVLGYFAAHFSRHSTQELSLQGAHIYLLH